MDNIQTRNNADNTEYKLTVFSCFCGIFVQAIVSNLVAILFIPLMKIYNLDYVHLGMLVGINFISQVSSDIIFSRLIDKTGFKKLVLPAIALSFAGLLLFSLSPYLFENILTGLIIATIVFSMASGLLEVLLSPIVSAIPNDNKGPAMSLMHSFYAWGQVVTIIFTTFLLFILGNNYWQLIVLLWCVIPVINFFMFLNAKFPPMVEEHSRLTMRDLIFKPFYMMALLAILFGGASEVIVNQWSSTFMEKGLRLPKFAGDLLGMCGFSVMLGLGRVIFGIWGSKMNLQKILMWSSLLAVVCYITIALSPIVSVNIIACMLCGLAVSLLWPGAIVMSAEKYPLAGGWMFAILAAAGDIGAAIGPWSTGMIIDFSKNSKIVAFISTFLNISTEQGAMRFALLLAGIFPLMCFFSHKILSKFK